MGVLAQLSAAILLVLLTLLLLGKVEWSPWVWMVMGALGAFDLWTVGKGLYDRRDRGPRKTAEKLNV